MRRLGCGATHRGYAVETPALPSGYFRVTLWILRGNPVDIAGLPCDFVALESSHKTLPKSGRDPSKFRRQSQNLGISFFESQDIGTQKWANPDLAGSKSFIGRILRKKGGRGTVLRSNKSLRECQTSCEASKLRSRAATKLYFRPSACRMRSSGVVAPFALVTTPKPPR